MKAALEKYVNQVYEHLLPLMAVFVPLCFLRKVMDNDIWFMLNHGRYILENGFVHVEPFTVHEGLRFSFEKWATCLTFYGAYEWLGANGVILITGIVGLITAWLIYRTLAYTSENKGISLLVSLVTSVPLICMGFTTRPQIFSFCLLVLEYDLLEHYVKTNNRKYLIGLPIISFVYMQFHSTMWPMFFIALMPYLFELELLSNFFCSRTEGYDKKILWLVAGISFLIGFINPYGYWSVFYLFNSLDMTNVGILELEPVTIKDFFTLTLFMIPFIYCVYILIYLFLCVKNRKPMKLEFPLRIGYYVVGTLLMTIYARRNVGFFIIFGGLGLGYLLKDLRLDNTISKLSLLMVCLMLIFFGTMFIPEVDASHREKYDKTYEPIGQLVELCEPTKTRLFTEFNSGSYAEWLGFRTYIDPRAEVFAVRINGKKDILQEFSDIRHGNIPIESIQELYDFDYWMASEPKILEQLKNSNKFKLIIDTEEQKIYQVVK